MKDSKVKKPSTHHGPMGGTGERVKDFKGTIKKIAGYLKYYKISLLLVLIFAILSTIITIAGPKVLGEATNVIADGYIGGLVYDQVMEKLPEGVTLPEGATGETVLNMMSEEELAQIPESQIDLIKNTDLSKRPSIDLETVGLILIILFGLYLISSLFHYIQSFIMTNIAQKITYNLRKKISKKINKLPLRYYDKTTHGDVLSRITNDVEMMNTNLSNDLSNAVISVTTVIGILIMMLTISPLMTLIAILILPVSLILVGTIVKASQKYFNKQQETLGKINGHIEEVYSGHNVIKAFNAEAKMTEKFDQINDELYTNGWKSQFFQGIMMPIIMFVGNIGFVAVCVLGGYLAVKGKIRIGDIQSFIQYVRNFTQQAGQFGSIIGSFQQTVAAAERVFEFLDLEEENKDSKEALELNNITGKVEFNNVRFGYDENKTIINDFNASINPGQKIAIVGPTGAGKTTIVKLLMRFYDINEGAIKIDGININDVKKSDLRNNLGMVLQDTWLFNGTIKDNIKYGNQDATDEEVIAASTLARASHFIDTLPDGYNMELNEEADNISGGQKQLLTIARAILKDPKILILDEATSSVDTRTEILIQEAMNNLMKGRTSFIIAHRLSTIRNADLILVMKDGDIVEQGTHDEFLNKNSFYATLYNSQFDV